MSQGCDTVGLKGLREYLLKWRTTRVEDRLIGDVAPIPVIDMGHAQTADDVVRLALNADGEITEENSTAQLQNIQNVRNWLEVNARPHFAALGNAPAGAVCAAAEPLIFITTVVAEATGQIVQVPVVPPVVGYRTCACITHIYSDQTDAAGILAWSTATGLTDGLVTTTIATVIDEIAPDWSPGLYWRGSAVNEALLVEAAIGQFGNVQELTFIGVHWGEVV